ncbi:MAG: ATP-binding cassette domain-containing protein [Gemmataceae bacterium]
MTQPAIQVQNLCKQYGPVMAVDRVSFQVAPGELVGFLGQNGAGKTTTMRILTTFMPASSGYASVAGFDVMYNSMDVRRHLGYLPESVPLYPEMRVEEYLQYRAKLKQVDREQRTKRVEYCLERCRIREVRRRLLSTLSKGYRQRVGLADTLLADPPVLILDEPLSGLDPVQQEETLNAIRGLGGRHTVLFSSHHLPDVEKVCDRVIIIDRGRIRFDDKLTTIQNRAPIMVLEVRGPAEQVTPFLKNQPGVSEVRALGEHDGAGRFELKTHHGQDLREPLNQKLVEKGWGVRRLELRREKLEDTFLRVIFQRD